MVKTETARPAWSLEPLGDALAFRAAERLVYESAWVIAVAKGVESKSVRVAAGDRRRSQATSVAVAADAQSQGHPDGTLQPCGGDLPPCYVVARESGGSYTAFNPNGCSGFCYGKYQFSASWGGKLGLPQDIRNATPAQQDAAARALYNGGAGCSNWDSC